MSYGAIATSIKAFLLADTTLDAYNFSVEMNIGGHFTSGVPNSEYTVQINVPEGGFIRPLNEPFSGSTDLDDTTDGDFETYVYSFVLLKRSSGYAPNFNIDDPERKTVFEFCDDVRNSIGKNWRINVNIEGYSYSTIRNEVQDGDGLYRLSFELYMEEAIELESR